MLSAIVRPHIQCIDLVFIIRRQQHIFQQPVHLHQAAYLIHRNHRSKERKIAETGNCLTRCGTTSFCPSISTLYRMTPRCFLYCLKRSAVYSLFANLPAGVSHARAASRYNCQGVPVVPFFYLRGRIHRKHLLFPHYSACAQAVHTMRWSNESA